MGFTERPLKPMPLMLASGNPDDIPYEQRLYKAVRAESPELADAIFRDILPRKPSPTSLAMVDAILKEVYTKDNLNGYSYYD